MTGSHQTLVRCTGREAMADGESGPVAVSRTIAASASRNFGYLADPGAHPAFDGSGMLRAGGSSEVITGVGDVFTMQMHNDRLGDYEMENHVVDYEADRRIAWEPALRAVVPGAETFVPVGTRPGHRWGFTLTPQEPGATEVTESYDCTRTPTVMREAMDNGNTWLESMTVTLQRLDALCTQAPGEP
jgi:uncharacterized protein YndB with AHSA1/START domain